jgi:hypothetical protein
MKTGLMSLIQRRETHSLTVTIYMESQQRIENMGSEQRTIVVRVGSIVTVEVSASSAKAPFTTSSSMTSV